MAGASRWTVRCAELRAHAPHELAAFARSALASPTHTTRSPPSACVCSAQSGFVPAASAATMRFQGRTWRVPLRCVTTGVARRARRRQAFRASPIGATVHDATSEVEVDEDERRATAARRPSAVRRTSSSDGAVAGDSATHIAGGRKDVLQESDADVETEEAENTDGAERSQTEELQPAQSEVSTDGPENDESGNVFQYAWPRLMLLVVSAVWGTNFGVVKLLDDSMRSSASAVARFSLSALALSPALINAPKAVFLHGLRIGTFVFSGYFFQSIALRTSEANKIAFLCSLAVVVVPLLDRLFPAVSSSEGDQGQKKSSSPLSSIVLAVLGVGLLELGGNTKPALGDLFGLFQAIGFALGFVNMERFQEFMPGYSIAISASQLLVVAMYSMGWYAFDSLLLYGNMDVHGITMAVGDPYVIGALLYTGLITTALTVVFENLALARVSASELTVLLSTEPFFAAAFSAFALDESLGSQGLAGGVLIIGACLLGQFQSKLLKWASNLRSRLTPGGKKHAN